MVQCVHYVYLVNFDKLYLLFMRLPFMQLLYNNTCICTSSHNYGIYINFFLLFPLLYLVKFFN